MNNDLRIICAVSFIAMSSVSATHVFNQYYFDFLKKLKDVAKAKKSEDANARILRKAIKNHYSSYDRLSAEYRTKFKEYLHAWVEFNPSVEWMTSDHTASATIYDGVTVKNIVDLTGDAHTTGYFTFMFALMSYDLSEEEVSNVLKYMRDKDASVFVHEDGAVLELIQAIKGLISLREKSKPDLNENEAFKAMEHTSLGKLAKEILEEVNVAEIQESMGDGDILSSLANPNSGITKLLGTVSQKMLTKMANGEIKHESLLQDAMKLASNIPGLGDLGAIGNIMKNFTGGDGEGGMPDLSGLGDLMKNFGMGGGGSRTTRSGGATTRPNTTAMNQHMRRTIQANQLRRKLEKKRKENVQGQVENE